MTFAEALRALRENDPKVIKIVLTALSPQQARQIAEALVANTTVTELILKKTEFDAQKDLRGPSQNEDTAIVLLSRALTRLQPAPTLTELTFESCRFVSSTQKNDTLDDLFQAVSQNASLQLLSFDGTDLTAISCKAFQSLIINNRTIKTLYLSETMITTECADVIYTSLLSNTSLDTLSLRNNNFASDLFTKPTKLLAFLRGCPRIFMRLDLGGNTYYNARDIRAIIDTLAENPCVRDLELAVRDNDALSTIVNRLSQGKSKLESLNLEHVNFTLTPQDTNLYLVQLLRSNTGLSTLQFSSCSFTPHQIKLLAEGVKKNSELRHFMIRYSNLSDADIRILLPQLRDHPRLSSLDFTGNKLTDECIAEFENFFRNPSRLVQLTLLRNNISIHKLQEFIIFLQKQGRVTNVLVDKLDTAASNTINNQIRLLNSEYSQALHLYAKTLKSDKTKAGNVSKPVAAFIEIQKKFQELYKHKEAKKSHINEKQRMIDVNFLGWLLTNDFCKFSCLSVYLTIAMRETATVDDFEKALTFIIENETALRTENVAIFANTKLDSGHKMTPEFQKALEGYSRIKYEHRNAYLILAIYQLAMAKNILLPYEYLRHAIEIITEKEMIFVQEAMVNGTMVMQQGIQWPLPNFLEFILNIMCTSELINQKISPTSQTTITPSPSLLPATSIASPAPVSALASVPAAAALSGLQQPAASPVRMTHSVNPIDSVPQYSKNVTPSSQYDKVLTAMRENQPSLTTVELHDLKAQEVEEIAYAMRENTHVRTLTLTNCHISLSKETTDPDSSAIKNFTEMLNRKHPKATIIKFNLLKCYFKTDAAENSVDDLLNALSKNDSITEFSLAGTRLGSFNDSQLASLISEQALGNLIEKNTKLLALDLSDTDIGNELADAVFKNMNINQTLQRLVLEQASLGSLIFKPTALVDMLRTRAKKLQHLNIAKNDYTKNDLLAILTAIAKSQCLQELCVQITDRAALSLIAEFLQKNETLLESLCIVDADFLDMQESSELAALIPPGRSLVSLSFRECRFEGVHETKRITELAKAICAHESFRSLTMVNCNLSYRQAQILFSDLRQHPGLRSICFEGNDLTDDSADTMMRFIHSAPELTHVSLKNNNFTVPRLQQLARDVQNKSLLIKLDLGDFDTHTITELNAALKMITAKYQYTLSEFEKAGRRPYLYLELPALYNTAHQELRELAAKCNPDHLKSVQAAMLELETSVIYFLPFHDAPAYVAPIVFLASIQRDNATADDFLTYTISPKEQDAIISACEKVFAKSPFPLPKNARQDITALSGKAALQLLLLAINQLAFNKKILISHASLLAALNFIAQSEQAQSDGSPCPYLNHISFERFVELLHHRLPAVRAALDQIVANTKPTATVFDTRPAVIAQLMVLPAVRALMLKHNLIIDGLASVQLDALIEYKTGYTATAFIATLSKHLCDYRHLSLCVTEGDAQSRVLTTLPLQQAKPFLITPFNIENEHLAKLKDAQEKEPTVARIGYARLLGSIRSDQRFNKVDVQLAHQVLNNDQFAITLRMNSSASVSTPGLASAKALDIEIQQVNILILEQLFNVLRFLQTVAPELNISKVEYFEQPVEVNFNIAKQHANLLVKKLNEFQFSKQQLQLIIPEPLAQIPLAQSAPLSLLWKSTLASVSSLLPGAINNSASRSQSK